MSLRKCTVRPLGESWLGASIHNAIEARRRPSSGRDPNPRKLFLTGRIASIVIIFSPRSLRRLKSVSVLIQIRDAYKSYGDQVLLEDAEASIVEGAKIGFVGRNGAGKSTLLRVMLGEEELDAGEVIKHPRLRLGYLRQHDPFQAGESALDFLMRDSGQPDWKCGEVAGKFELKGVYLTGPVTELSGGWQTRLKLSALLLHEPNLLLLDEPTNFLDLRTQMLLEQFLKGFRAGALVVSHDRAFLKNTCDQTLDISRGKLTMYPGKIAQFLEYQRELREHDQRVNQSVITKQKQLEKFIAKNRAGANTASQAPVETEAAGSTENQRGRDGRGHGSYSRTHRFATTGNGAPMLGPGDWISRPPGGYQYPVGN